MRNIRPFGKVAKSTADCVEILSIHKKSNWKRKSKFTYKFSHNYSGEITNTVRVFTDGVEVVTLISTQENTLLCKNLDFSEHKLILEKIQAISKFYYTHDYGNVWYDPYDKKVWVSGGDGGMFYSEEPREFVAKKVSDDDFEWLEMCPDFHTKVTELNDSVFEAESDPLSEYSLEEEEETQNYILVGQINDVGDLDSDGETDREESIADLKEQLKRYEKAENYEKCAEIQAKIKEREK